MPLLVSLPAWIWIHLPLDPECSNDYCNVQEYELNQSFFECAIAAELCRTLSLRCSMATTTPDPVVLDERSLQMLTKILEIMRALTENMKTINSSLEKFALYQPSIFHN